MLRWALGFLAVALVAALFGFGGTTEALAGIARILFFVFIGLSMFGFTVALVQHRQGIGQES